MKIGIITVHDSANFGSYLQAFALKYALEELGHEVKFIKTRTREQAKKVFLGSKLNLMKYIKNYKSNIEKYNIFMEDIELFPEIELNQVNQDNVDIVIIGSDELWNVNKKVFTRPHFYGINVPVENKITYAVSLGQASLKDYDNYTNLVNGMKELDSILVRDERTKSVVEKLTNQKTSMVCDPTFLIDVDKFYKPYENPIKKDYILIYSYNFTKKQEEYIKRFAKENDLIIVSACLKHEWSDCHINCSPLQFCQIIKDANHVVTTTFHGTIFSILNKKSFISMPVSPKTDDVLTRTNMKAALYTESNYDTFEKILKQKLDYKKAEENIIQMRQDSKKVLEDVLKHFEA